MVSVEFISHVMKKLDKGPIGFSSLQYIKNTKRQKSYIMFRSEKKIVRDQSQENLIKK